MFQVVTLTTTALSTNTVLEGPTTTTTTKQTNPVLSYINKLKLVKSLLGLTK